MKGDNTGTGCGQGVKYLMFAINFLFFLCGAAIMGVGIWMIIERNFMSAIYGNELMTVAIYMIMIGGAIIFVVSFLGCWGALMENKVLIVIYLITLCVMFLSLLIGGILAIILRTEIREQVLSHMRMTLQDHYGVNLEDKYNRGITDAWDRAQDYLRCCSVEDQSWGVYRQSEWYKIQPGSPEVDKALVPLSCCITDQYHRYINKQKCQNWMAGPPAKNGGENNEALNYRGCYSAGYDFIMEYSGYLIGMGIGIGVSLIAGIILSIMLYRMVD